VSETPEPRVLAYSSENLIAYIAGLIEGIGIER